MSLMVALVDRDGLVGVASGWKMGHLCVKEVMTISSALGD